MGRASGAPTLFPPSEPPAGPSGIDPNVATERNARLEMADALDLSENLVGKKGGGLPVWAFPASSGLTGSVRQAGPSGDSPRPPPPQQYLSLVRGLSSLMDVEQLMGLRTLKHLPQAERDKVGLLRHKNLELLLDRISKLKSRLERKESLLKEYEGGDSGPFRYRPWKERAGGGEKAERSAGARRGPRAWGKGSPPNKASSPGRSSERPPLPLAPPGTRGTACRPASRRWPGWPTRCTGTRRRRHC